MRPKGFVIIFITYVYTIDVPNYGISQRQHVFRVYVIHSTKFIFLYGENGYFHEKIWAKITENL